MPDPTRTNVATGTGSLATTTASFGFTATANRLLVLVIGADDYKTGNPSGWTLSPGCSQEVYLGHYVFWKIASGGETSVQYTIGSASKSAWLVCEFDNIDTSSPLDVSNGQNRIASASSYTTPSVTPSTGRRFALASMGFSRGSFDFTGVGTWLNSFTEQAESYVNGGGTRDAIGLASLALDGNGSTSVSSGATCTATGGNADSQTGIILVFRVATGGGGGSIKSWPPQMQGGMRSLTGGMQ